MKIAVPSDDQAHVAAHFGRARGFLVYDVVGTVAKREEYRITSHHHEHDHGCGSGCGARHESVLGALAGCEVVIARGIGEHMRDEILGCGMEIFVTDKQNAQAAVDQYLWNGVPESASLCCFE